MMSDSKKCELCDLHCEMHLEQMVESYFTKNCKYTPRLSIAENIFNARNSNALLNIIFSDIIRKNDPNNEGKSYYYDDSEDAKPKSIRANRESLNAYYLIKDYPESTLDLFDRVLLNMYYLSDRGCFRIIPRDGKIGNFSTQTRICMCDNHNNKSDYTTIESLEKIGYVSIQNNKLYFTPNGWNRITRLIDEYENSRTAFIALDYTGTDDIRKTLKDATEKCNFNPIVMDEFPHNNQIVPEMFEQIKRARFLIMDVTKPNLGAYYEAGVARGLGKQVIITCRKSEYIDDEKHKRPHFDVAQQSMVIWETLEELEKKLIERITLTIV